MRTTLTLEPDVEALLKESVYHTGKTFKQAVNDAVRSGLSKPAAKAQPFVQKTFDLGRPVVDLTKALALAADLEDQDTLVKLARGV